MMNKPSGSGGAVVRVRNGRAEVWCRGCTALHLIDLGMWEMDGGLVRPSFYPEVSGYAGCIAEIRDGQWHYSPHSTHELAGQVVAMVPIGGHS